LRRAGFSPPGLLARQEEEQARALDRETRLDFARPHYEAMSPAERHALLRVPISELVMAASVASEEQAPGLTELLLAAVARSRKQGTWKSWSDLLSVGA